MKKGSLIKSVILITMFIFGSIFLVSCGSSEGDITNYLKLKLDGPNGFAEIQNRHGIDYNAKYKKLIKEKTGNDFGIDDETSFYNGVKFEYDKTKKNYSNGDKVKVKVKFKKSYLDEYNLDFKDSEIELIVSDLPEAKEEVDPLKYGKLVFEGASPYLTLKYEPNEEDDYEDEMYIENDEDYYKNGDTAVINFNSYFDDGGSSENEFYGVKPNVVKQKVSGQKSYIQDASELKKLDDKVLIKSIKDKLEEEPFSSFANLKVLNKTVAFKKKYEKTSLVSASLEYVIYSCSANRKSEFGESGKVYFLAVFTELKVDGNKVSKESIDVDVSTVDDEYKSEKELLSGINQYIDENARKVSDYKITSIK